MKTPRFEQMREFRPEPPKLTDENIALRVANAIFDDVNTEEQSFWHPEEREKLVDQMVAMIIKRESVKCLFWHLHRGQSPIDDRKNRGVYPWGYDGVQNYPESMLSVIATTVLDAALTEYEEKYE